MLEAKSNRLFAVYPAATTNNQAAIAIPVIIQPLGMPRPVSTSPRVVDLAIFRSIGSLAPELF